MWTRTYSKTFQGIKRQEVWRIWTDINKWPTWHNDLEYCKIEGDFKVGNHFILKPKGVAPVKILLTKVEPGYSFTDCTHFFGAKMEDTHRIEETKDGLKLTNTLVVTGPLKWIWITLVAKNIAKTVPEDIDCLAKLLGYKYKDE